MKVCKLENVRLDAATPGTDTEIGQPEAAYIVWSEEYVPRGGPRAGQKCRSTNGVSIPVDVLIEAYKRFAPLYVKGK